MICKLKLKIDNLKFEIWKKIGKIKTLKNCKLGKCGNLEKFGNFEKFEIWKKNWKFRKFLEILKNFGKFENI